MATAFFMLPLFFFFFFFEHWILSLASWLYDESIVLSNGLHRVAWHRAASALPVVRVLCRGELSINHYGVRIPGFISLFQKQRSSTKPEHCVLRSAASNSPAAVCVPVLLTDVFGNGGKNRKPYSKLVGHKSFPISLPNPTQV